MQYTYHRNFENFLALQRVSLKTKEAYLRAVNELTSFHNMEAANLTNDQVQDFLHYIIQEKQLAWSSCNVFFCGLKKYYREYLGHSETEFSIPPRTRSKKIPMLLSREEVAKILRATTNLKHQALLATVYGSGLRVSELVQLRARDIESDRMMLRVEEGKGRKGRYTVLSSTCLELLRNYWRACRPEEWLFFGKNKHNSMSIGTAQRVYYQAKERAGITRGRGIHTLRHCFASHLLEDGVEIYAIKRWMGHSSLKTTYRYIHLSPDYLSKVKSPLDMDSL